MKNFSPRYLQTASPQRETALQIGTVPCGGAHEQESLPLMGPETLDNAILVASLAYLTARTPLQRRKAKLREDELRRQQEQQRRQA